MGDAIQADRVAEGLDDVILADDVLEPLGPIAAGDDGVADGIGLGRGRDSTLGVGTRGTLRRALGREGVRPRGRTRRPASGGRGEPGRCSRAHEGDAYGCCVPALTRFASPHCPGPPRLTPTPAIAELRPKDEIVRIGPGRARSTSRPESGRRPSSSEDAQSADYGLDPRPGDGKLIGRSVAGDPADVRDLSGTPEAGRSPIGPRAARPIISTTRGSHGPTLDRPPLARLGGRPPGLRADPGQRPQGPGPPPPACPGRGLRPVLPGRLVRRAGRARPGLAHFVEHMLFKGTERFPKGQIDRLAFVAAGQSNAETGEDSTHYWFAFPSDRWELALAIESDRMRGATFDPREVEAERQVIAEERARDQESPFARLDQAHLAASYVRHPYRNPILGWPDDLARIEVGDLKSFYRDHYRPDGAVLVVVGDVDARPGPRRLRGPLRRPRPPAGRPDRPPTFEEPRQVGRRDFRAGRARIGRPGPLRLAHRPARPSRRPGARRPLRPPDLRPTFPALGSTWSSASSWRPGSRPGRKGRGGPASSSSRSRPSRAPSPSGSTGRSPRPSARLADEGPTAGRTGPVAEPARSGLAMGAGRPRRPGRRARPVRPQRRLAGLAGRASGRPGGPGRGHPPGRLHLPGRVQPDGRLVDPPAGPVDDGPHARRGPRSRRERPPRRPRPDAADRPGDPRRAHRSWPIIAPHKVDPAQRDAAPDRASARDRASSPWSCSSTPACSASRSPAWPT